MFFSNLLCTPATELRVLYGKTTTNKYPFYLNLNVYQFSQLKLRKVKKEVYTALQSRILNLRKLHVLHADIQSHFHQKYKEKGNEQLIKTKQKLIFYSNKQVSFKLYINIYWNFHRTESKPSYWNNNGILNLTNVCTNKGWDFNLLLLHSPNYCCLWNSAYHYP